MNDLRTKALKYHFEKQGKIEIKSKVKLENREDLSLAYTPGVAFPCLEIKENSDDVYKYTSKSNTVAVITDGSAVLGLGNIGAKASIPVMEGKCLLFKKFAGIDAIPICIDSTDTEEIIKTIKLITPTLGGINLEDISFPRCIEIEKRLIDELDIPVFHDDQHGTAIIVTAALINALKVVNKKPEDIVVSLSGLGAAGSNIARMIRKLNVKKLYAYNKEGIITYKKYNLYDKYIKELLDENIVDSFDDYEVDRLANIVKDSDCFIGVSVADLLEYSDINTMKDKPIVFALANPNPEINYEEVKKSKVCIYATGRSDLPNQINNVLAFPGLFKGALKARCKITEKMYFEVSKGIANIINENELTSTNIIPSVFNEDVVQVVSSIIEKIGGKDEI